MDVLKEEPSFSHDHFSEVKAASTGQTEPANTAATSGRHKAVAVAAIMNMIVSPCCMRWYAVQCPILCACLWVLPGYQRLGEPCWHLFCYKLSLHSTSMSMCLLSDWPVLTVGLAADEDVFDLIKQEVQRDVQGKRQRAAGVYHKISSSVSVAHKCRH